MAIAQGVGDLPPRGTGTGTGEADTVAAVAAGAGAAGEIVPTCTGEGWVFEICVHVQYMYFVFSNV